LKLKAAILLCIVFFASIATLTASIGTIEQQQVSTLDVDPLPPPPGPTFSDPIGGGGGPH
jgi:hypothetical protein